MQAVIIAAGEGMRMRPLTLERPKPLVLIEGKPLLEHIIDRLPTAVDEIILVVGYKKEMIEKHFGTSYKGRTISYVHQWMPSGTAHALSMAIPLLKDERFLLMNADDLHGTPALEKALSYPLAIIVATHADPKKFGVIELNGDGTLASIIEKPENPPSNLVSTGAMVLDKRLFEYPVARHANGEYYMTYPLNFMAKDHPIAVVEQDFWVPVGSPQDIPKAEAKLRADVGQPSIHTAGVHSA
jgi:NDP-sugar pyrophosphorylase family protein